jgi:hypothetical protein
MTIEFKIQEGEIFKEIDGLCGYHVSNHGRVYSDCSQRTLRCYINKHGYVVFTIKDKKYKAHRLVAKAFIDNPSNRPVVNHIDGCKFNNHVSNLEWTDHDGNFLHAVITGLIPQNPGSLLTLEVAKEIRAEYSTGEYTFKELCDKYGLSISTINKVIQNKRFHDPGYTPRPYVNKYNSVINFEKATEIRDKYATGAYTKAKLSKEYGLLGNSTVAKIINNTTWTDPNYTPPPTTKNNSL